MRARLILVLAIPILVAVSLPAVAAIIRVPDDQPTIQAGIDAASAGDSVLVACGTYYEHDITMKSGVCLTSETGQADCVVVDAQQEGRVLHCSGANSLSSVVGFTITGGVADYGGGMYCISSAPALAYCTFSGNEAGVNGGGMSCNSSSPTLTDCTFAGNQASGAGGAVYCQSSMPTLTGCMFSENQADGGGGMFCSDCYSMPTLTECTFVGNQASSDGGGMLCGSSSPTLTNCAFAGNHAEGGGGMWCVYSSAALTGCTFLENDSDYYGGGMYCNSSSPTLTDCTFSGNQAGNGGGMDCDYSSPTLTDCTFSGNEAGFDGGGMHCYYSSSPTLEGCTFSENLARVHGGGMFCDHYSSPTLTDCIIAFAPAGEAVYCWDEYCAPLLVCCDLYGNAGGDWVGCIDDQYGVGGNFSEDPLFCDMYNDDFTLCANSPCLPGGNTCGVLVGARDQGCPDCDSPVEPSSWGAIKAIYR